MEDKDGLMWNLWHSNNSKEREIPHTQWDVIGHEVLNVLWNFEIENFKLDLSKLHALIKNLKDRREGERWTL